MTFFIHRRKYLFDFFAISIIVYPIGWIIAKNKRNIMSKIKKASADIVRLLRSHGLSYGDAIGVLNVTLDLLRKQGDAELDRLHIAEGIENRPNELESCTE